MNDIRDEVDRRGWAVPEGWQPERFGACSRCHERVLYCRTRMGTMLKFDRNGRDHFGTCTNKSRARER